MVFVYLVDLENWNRLLFHLVFTSSNGVRFIDWWIVFLYCLITDGNSDTQSAFPARKIGFFNNILIVLLTLSAILAPLSVNLERFWKPLLLKIFGKIETYHSFPLPLSNLSGDRFDVVRIFENSSLIPCQFLFWRGVAQVYLLKLSNMMNIYIEIFYYLKSYNQSCRLNRWTKFHQCDYRLFYWFCNISFLWRFIVSFINEDLCYVPLHLFW